MATGYGDKERTFLEALKSDTGRDLGEWMMLISDQGLRERNDIIDFLRQRGFMFSKASWLERIHHNGGRPIYAGDSPRKPSGAREARAALVRVRAEHPPKASSPLPGPAGDLAPGRPSQRASLADPAGLDEVLLKAKAYRPLAQHTLAEILRAVPGAEMRPRATHVEIGRGGTFAVLAVSPRELRLGLRLGRRPFGDGIVPARFAPSAVAVPPTISHMCVLTDARQVNADLLALVQEAAAYKE